MNLILLYEIYLEIVKGFVKLRFRFNSYELQGIGYHWTRNDISKTDLLT